MILLALVLSLIVNEPHAEVPEFLKKAGAMLTPSNLPQQICQNKNPCQCIASEAPGTYFFLEQSATQESKVCYVGDDHRLVEKSVKLQHDRVTLDGSVHTSLESLNAKFPNAFSKVWAKVSTTGACLSSLQKVAEVANELKHSSTQVVTCAPPSSPNLPTPENESPQMCSALETRQGIRKLSKVGAGSYGTIHGVCFKTAGPKEDCDWVEKEMPIRDEDEEASFEKEVSIFKILGPSITPALKNSYVCRANDNRIVGKIFLRALEGDLHHLLKHHDIKPSDLQKIFYAIQEMHKKNVVHQDLHGGNILYSRKPDGSFEFYLTDFGQAHHYSTGSSAEKSPRVQNFRLGGGSGTFPQQKEYDFESIISDLKDKFGMNIALKTPSRTVLPKPLPRQTQKNYKILRERMIEAVAKKQVDPEDNTVLIDLPERGKIFVPVDPELMSEGIGQRLAKLNSSSEIHLELK